MTPLYCDGKVESLPENQLNHMSNRVLETVTGYENAQKAIATLVASFNNLNGQNRMVFTRSSGLEAYDNEGSGEFYIAVCLNINEAESCANEIYQIEGAW